MSIAGETALSTETLYKEDDLLEKDGRIPFFSVLLVLLFLLLSTTLLLGGYLYNKGKITLPPLNSGLPKETVQTQQELTLKALPKDPVEAHLSESLETPPIEAPKTRPSTVAETEVLTSPESIAKTESITPLTLAEVPTATLPQTNPSPVNEVSEWWKYPSEVLLTSIKPDQHLTVVNKKYALPSSYLPTELVSVNTLPARTPISKSITVSTLAITPLAEMLEAIQKESIDISIISGYRSYSYQAEVYQYWLRKNNQDIEITDQYSARPGHSQHQLASSVDFSSREVNDELIEEFESTPAGRWLRENAYKYGFVLSYPKGKEALTGYAYEPWHYRYIGVSLAGSYIAQSLTLDEFLLNL